ncbi:DUF3433 domain-containing protein [Aspergillus mulundensis]|uniref:Uncharacterized protein n=1 Tax=Aspergillus mulundensis TaxID=1810919 RepID=A0A3D8RY22_9EURO|nr:Uncharacterized protein DSM5745_05804 [Aspergillus mulundensis]RDW78952.1 Uncharacterized protein DSM5745_05804 [Aspergillus mulundensis]
MSGGRPLNLYNVYLRIKDRYWAARQPGSPPNAHARPTHPTGWRPIPLRPTYLTLIACLMLFLLIILEALSQYSERTGGLRFFEDTDDLTNFESFAYNYIPVIVALVLATLWSFIDFDVLRLEPYFQMARPEGCPATVLFINYNFGQSFITPIASAKRRHWLVLSVSLVTLLIRIFHPALQSSLLELREVTTISDEKMKTWSKLVDLSTQARWFAAQENSESSNFEAYFTDSTGLQQTRSGQFAVGPVQIPTDDRRETTVWSLNQTIYWTELDCQDLFTSNFSVSHNETESWLYWDVQNVPITGLGEKCTLDFSYDNVLFPNVDFLQVRYWEPTWSDTPFTGAERAFVPDGCDSIDLYGVLLSVNSSSFGENAISSVGDELTSSATMFACNIEYFKGEAEITMHANSSITNAKIFNGTTQELTQEEFNIDSFQSFLAHRALYTSDMLFITTNETTGERTLTELPVISQYVGDTEPILVLDSSKTMSSDELTAKVTRGVKQTFILTMSRLFNPDVSPTTTAALRSTGQVSLAIVAAVARCAETVLGIGTILTLILLRYYHKRPNILQSDPGSIGAMCSMLTDVFGFSNVLADPRAGFHQFSTRQLRRLFRDCRLQWYHSPLGSRLEIVTHDGNPVRLDEQTRVRADPRPHFLVIPIFILEFLLLAAVIVLMSLVISTFAKQGGFQHLNQSSSSFLQVVLSFLPSVVASAVGALCTSIHRNLSVLEPWVHLQRGMASVSTSLTMNYSCQNPWTVLPKAAKNRHVLLGLISIACIANTVLTTVAGGLFTQQLTESATGTDTLYANYSHSVFRQNDFAADFTEYDLIQTSITSGVPLLSWTSSNHSFAPIEIRDPDQDSTYSATTLGVGADLDCRILSIPDNLVWRDDGPYWTYHPTREPERECWVKMTPPHDPNDRYALSINFFSPIAKEETDICQTSTVLVVGRWNYTAASGITNNNTVALHCEPDLLLQNFSIVFDHKGQILEHWQVPDSTITSGNMYDNATISLGQFNKVFAAIPQSFYGASNDTSSNYVSSYDWAGFLVALLYKRDITPITRLDPDRLMNLSQTVYQWVYSTYFSLWREIYLLPLDEPIVAENATVIWSAWRMEPSVSSLVIAMTIIGLDTIVVLIVFGTRRGRFKGPRIPRSIGSIIPWIANSHMIHDFDGTYGWTNAQRQTHLERLKKRYTFRMFLREDNEWRYAVDEEPPVAATKTTPPSDTTTVAAKPPEEIELSVIENRETPPGETPPEVRVEGQIARPETPPPDYEEEPPPPAVAVAPAVALALAPATSERNEPETREQDSRAT